MKDVYWTDKLYPCAADMNGITVDQLNEELIEIHEMVFGMRRTAELLLANGLDSETMGMLRMVDIVSEKTLDKICTLLPDGAIRSENTPNRLRRTP